MIERVLEPEAMESADEARDYDLMDHATVNAIFVDDTNGFGPETITVNKRHPGTKYVFAVHNYSANGQYGTSTLSTGRSGANDFSSCQLASVILRCPGPTEPRPSVASSATQPPLAYTSNHMWYARNGLPPRSVAYTSPSAVRLGTPSARHMPAANIAYSVQSPASVFATFEQVAIATIGIEL